AADPEWRRWVVLAATVEARDLERIAAGWRSFAGLLVECACRCGEVVELRQLHARPGNLSPAQSEGAAVAERVVVRRDHDFDAALRLRGDAAASHQDGVLHTGVRLVDIIVLAARD